MSRSRAGKTEHVGMQLFPVTVQAACALSPHLRRITLQDQSLRGFRDDGPDQRFKLLLPRDGQRQLTLPEPGDWFANWQAMPDHRRPVMRTYTVRAARPSLGELDVDIAVHDPGGPGARWARAAMPGDRVAIFGAFAEYEVPVDAGAQVIAGDLSALPAIAAIADRLSADDLVYLVIELPDLADSMALTRRDIGEVRWVTSRPGRPGAALLDAVCALPDWPQRTYCWFAADQATAAELRRHAVRDRGLDPAQVMFMGYWRTDGPLDPD